MPGKLKRLLINYSSSMCEYPGNNKRLSTASLTTFKNPECHFLENYPLYKTPPDPVANQEVTRGSSWFLAGFNF